MTRRRPRRAIPAKRPRRGAPGEDLVEVLREQLAQVRRLLKKGRGHDKKPLSQQQYRMLSGTVGELVEKIGRMTGETLEMPETKILKLPAFRRLIETIARALDPWPEAMAAVAAELERVDRGEAAEERIET